MVVLMLMHYLDGDLGQYYEYGTNVMVNPVGSDATGLSALQSAVAFVHHLPVDQAFTLEAGRTIWGYPKVMADFDHSRGPSVRLRRVDRRHPRRWNGLRSRPEASVRWAQAGTQHLLLR
jgi:hypothetical protein